MLGETTMVVRDFHNITHDGIALADAMEIAKQQGLDYRAKWARKNAAKDAVAAVTLDTPDWQNALAAIAY